MKKTIISIAIFVFASIAQAKTYEIIEPDFVETAREYAESDEFRQYIIKERDKTVARLLDREGTYLPHATDNETYEVGYTYTLPQDIPKVDRGGNIIGILYPKGYTFSPLRYLNMVPPPMVVFSPCDEQERLFVDEYVKGLPAYMLVTTRCKLKDTKGYTVPVYQVQPEMVERFKLKASVSVVSVDVKKGVFRVQVFKTSNDN